MIGKRTRKFFTPASGKLGRGFGVFFLLISFSLTDDIGGGALSILLRGERYDQGAQIEMVDHLLFLLASFPHTSVVALLLYVSHRIVRFRERAIKCVSALVTVLFLACPFNPASYVLFMLPGDDDETGDTFGSGRGEGNNL